MNRILFASGLCLAFSIAAAGIARHGVYTPPISDLQYAAAFATIPDREERSKALFREASKVIEHPRCMNCHPRNDSPTQTDIKRRHVPAVTRGADGHGVPGMKCATCHQQKNFDAAGVPGAPHWGLAPQSMAWQGLSTSAICMQIKDRRRNGDRSLEQIRAHMTDDALVGWAWRPGRGRTPAPGTQQRFGELIAAWIASGAVCPAAAAVRN